VSPVVLGAQSVLPSATFTVHAGQTPTASVVIILALTVLALAPTLLVLFTGFVEIVVVLSITRNALGLQTTPPNQVLAGLALFLSLFVMAPTLAVVEHQALLPYLHGHISAVIALERAEGPIKAWMLRHTRTQELALFDVVTHHAGVPPLSAPMDAVVPAFILSELHSAFVMGFVIYVPFLVIDLVVSSVLMSLGMMMLPPTLISLPFKLLLFVLVDGWTLVAHALLVSLR
jgi:flagellar biosynthetic protein FliP